MSALSPSDLSANLAQFIGSESYHRTHPRLLATDGAHYLAEHAGAFWLLDLVWSVLPKINDDFAVLELSVEDRKGALEIHDGREPKTVYHAQDIPYTDFPLEHLKLYVQDAGGEWVVMLTGEY